MEKTIGIKAIKLRDYKFTLSENKQGKPVANMSRIMKAGPNKGQYVQVEGYYFKSVERREEWVMEKMAMVNKWAEDKTSRKNKKAEARANMVNPYKIGDILYDSWGYDQTNIDFYQVTEVKPKSVVIREIAGKHVDGTYGHDSCNVTPVKDSFTGKPETKPIQVSCWNDNQGRYYISSRHGSISHYDCGEKGIYSSWGH